ncbi:MAG: histidine phosphatase family protein [Anaerolineales bacterium]|jgi:phosphohistidine phosphatase
MKTLLVLRHAKSSWREAELADHDRPLNKRGKHDAPRMGELMREEGLLPDLILTSSARRALTTAELVAEASGYDGEIQVSRDLYAAGPEEFIDALSALPDELETVMVVGHNPGLEELVEALTEEASAMPTAALAQVELEIERWVDLQEEGGGRLVNLWLPRNLDGRNHH